MSENCAWQTNSGLCWGSRLWGDCPKFGSERPETGGGGLGAGADQRPEVSTEQGVGSDIIWEPIVPASHWSVVTKHCTMGHLGDLGHTFWGKTGILGRDWGLFGQDERGPDIFKHVSRFLTHFQSEKDPYRATREEYIYYNCPLQGLSAWIPCVQWPLIGCEQTSAHSLDSLLLPTIRVFSGRSLPGCWQMVFVFSDSHFLRLRAQSHKLLSGEKQENNYLGPSSFQKKYIAQEVSWLLLGLMSHHILKFYEPCLKLEASSLFLFNRRDNDTFNRKIFNHSTRPSAGRTWCKVY